MSANAFIFDVYGTLLEVGPPPADAEVQWASLWSEILGSPPGMSRLDFSVSCGRIIAERHLHSRALGIHWPEVSWPSIVVAAIPALAKLSSEQLEEFIFGQINLGHSISFSPETAALLRWLASHEVLLGIASNAQAYTLRELEEKLQPYGLGMDLFEEDLCFWSYQHGFSKPDPHVFQLLSARLEQRGIAPSQIVMIGDRIDNDIEPAHRHGWQAWHCTAGPKSWDKLQAIYSPQLQKASPKGV